MILGKYLIQVPPSEQESNPHDHPILGFHSRDQQPCFSTKTKEDVSITIAFNSRRIGWGHQHGGRDVM